MEFKNRKVFFEYFILDKFEAGIKLKGEEIKSIRDGKLSLDDCYVIIKDNKPYILNMFIATYFNSSRITKLEENRTRELLLNKNEILKLQQKVKEKGLTIVCTKGYFKGSLFKLEIALVRGKNLRDKRETIKERDLSRIEKTVY